MMTDKKVLLFGIRDAVRAKTKEIEKFKAGNGAIRILIHPCNEEADFWLGGMSSFSKTESDIVDYEFVYHIAPGGSHLITGTWNEVEQKVSCYGYSALKIAHCALSAKEGKGQLSGNKLDTPYLTEDNGFGPERGALCVTVFTCHESLPRPRTVDFCRIYVCVSGADSIDDLRCAVPAIDVIKKFFSHESSRFGYLVPKLPEL